MRNVRVSHLPGIKIYQEEKIAGFKLHITLLLIFRINSISEEVIKILMYLPENLFNGTLFPVKLQF